MPKVVKSLRNAISRLLDYHLPTIPQKALERKMKKKTDPTTYLVQPAVEHYRLLRRINQDLIYPPFLDKMIALLEICSKSGSLYHVTQGTRTWEQQDSLHAQGRSKPGQIVTNARGGQSYHNFGIAMDCVFDTDPHRPGLWPSWERKLYDLLAEEAVYLDLEPGHLWRGFKDSPHIQLPIGTKGLNLGVLRQEYSRAGMQAVWALLDKHSW